jgi:hypothetical protein
VHSRRLSVVSEVSDLQKTMARCQVWMEKHIDARFSPTVLANNSIGDVKSLQVDTVRLLGFAVFCCSYSAFQSIAPKSLTVKLQSSTMVTVPPICRRKGAVRRRLPKPFNTRQQRVPI